MKKYMTMIFVIGIVMLLILPINVSALDDTTATATINDVSAGAGAAVDSHDTINTIDRKFISPGIIPMAGTNNFLVAPTEDSSFRSIFELIMVHDNFSDGAVDNLAKGGDVNSNLQIINEDKIVPRIKYKKGEIPMIKVVVMKNGDKLPKGFAMTGYVDGEADDADTNSFHVAGKMMKKAMADGNNCIVFTKEGGHRGVFASGWGIGTYVVGGKVSNDNMNSGTAGGGTGYARNNTGTEEKPWLQGMVGVIRQTLFLTELIGGVAECGK